MGTKNTEGFYDACGPYAKWLGYQEAQAELAKYKKALQWACEKAEPRIPCPNGLENCDREGPWECWQCVEEMALAEASK